MRHILAAAALAGAGLISTSATAESVEVRVLSPSPLRPVLADVAPRFEESTGYSLALNFDSIGAVRDRIAGGESYDVAIAIPPMLQALAGEGRIVEDSATAFARDAFAMAVPAGTEPPDIGDTDAFREAMLEVETVAIVVGGAAGRPHFDALFERLGIADEMEAKIVEVPSPGAAVEAVRDGDAAAGFMVASVVLAAEGIDSAGALPDEAQFPIVFAAGLVADAEAEAAAQAFIDYLASPEAEEAIRKHGMEPEAS